MIVKYRNSFFTDLKRIRDINKIEEIEFITEFASNTLNANDIPGIKPLRQYPNMARIEIAPYRIGVEIVGETIIFKRILKRMHFYEQFP